MTSQDIHPYNLQKKQQQVHLEMSVASLISKVSLIKSQDWTQTQAKCSVSITLPLHAFLMPLD